MGLFHVAASCLRYFLHLLLTLLDDDESSRGPLLGGYPPAAVEMVPVHNPVCRQSEPPGPLPSSSSRGYYAPSNRAVPFSMLESQHARRGGSIANAECLPNRFPSKQRPYSGKSSIGPSSSFTLREPPCDLPILLNCELPSQSRNTSMSASSRSSMVSTPVLPSWSPTTPTTPTRQPTRKVTAGGGKLMGLGIQILYDDDEKPRPFDGLGLVPSRMKDQDSAEEEDLGVPSRILLEEIYHTFTSPDILAAAAPFPTESELEDDETSVGDVFKCSDMTKQGPNAVSTPRKGAKKHGRVSYGLPTAASVRRTRRTHVDETGGGDDSGSSDTSGGSAQKPAWRY
ncbi:hypothetical protein EDB92DRAFT_1906243 [Lactarius akahatsu]|uniref:Uncharacterized protein n=1 Tax=Lactarius akahatsu TaxID=416441 RepID=A0AAD4L5I5_9AGAM|nr:hypothetical protein EDB92DRAFT_1906243 [Lactarius akahatsu]